MIGNSSARSGRPSSQDLTDDSAQALFVRIFGWSMLNVLAVYLLNNFLTYWLEWPGAFGANSGSADGRSWVQTGLYVAATLVAITFVLRTRERSLRDDKERIHLINSFLVRAAFWAVLIIGLIDVSLSFFRSEELLDSVFGEVLAKQLVRADVRGPFVHMPVFVVSIVIASFTRTIGVIWFALLIAVVELLIVAFRFVFSYEQVFMTDLVRFWYAPLFLFGSAYTLREEGHVRVDVFYAEFTAKTKGLVNAIGTVLLGMPLCWLILIVGTSGKTGVINSALLGFEIEGLGDSLYVLYLMTVFMGFFAILMLIEFVAFLFNAVADYLGSPARRSFQSGIIQ